MKSATRNLLPRFFFLLSVCSLLVTHINQGYFSSAAIKNLTGSRHFISSGSLTSPFHALVKEKQFSRLGGSFIETENEKEEEHDNEDLHSLEQQPAFNHVSLLPARINNAAYCTSSPPALSNRYLLLQVFRI